LPSYTPFSISSPPLSGTNLPARNWKQPTHLFFLRGILGFEHRENSHLKAGTLNLSHSTSPWNYVDLLFTGFRWCPLFPWELFLGGKTIGRSRKIGRRRKRGMAYFLFVILGQLGWRRCMKERVSTMRVLFGTPFHKKEPNL
jgi:hypothetical protein